MDTGFEQRARDFGVGFGRHGETHGIDAPDEAAPIGCPSGFAFDGDVARGRLVAVADDDHFGLPLGGERGVNACVLASEMADADNCGA